MCIDTRSSDRPRILTRSLYRYSAILHIIKIYVVSIFLIIKWYIEILVIEITWNIYIRAY
jgi:hypothetical protein